MRRWPWLLAPVLIGLGLLLPADALLDALASRFSTVRGFRPEFARGLGVLRAALAVDGLLVLAVTFLLSRRPWTAAKAAPAPLETAPSWVLYGIGMLAALPGLFESFQDDEWRCLEQYVRHGPLVIVSRSYADNHVLYSLLAWPFVSVLGPTEAAVRLPSLLITPLAAPILYRYLRREHPRPDAFLAALPLAVSPFLVQYAHEGRAYGPLAAVLLGLVLLRDGAFEGLRRDWLAFVALGVAAVYLHVFAAAAVAGLCLPALARPERRPRAAAALMAVGGASLLLLSPVLPSYFVYASAARPTSSWDPVDAVAGLFVSPLPAVALLPFLAPLVRGVRVERPLAAAAGATLAALGLIVVATSAGTSARFLTPILPISWALAGRGLASWRKAGAVVAVALAAIGLAADAAYYARGRRDYRGAAREIGRLRGPDESLAVIFDGRPMTPYLREPLRVMDENELRKEGPDWLTIVDVNASADMRRWLAENYEVVFRKPSVRGELQGYRRRRERR